MAKTEQSKNKITFGLSCRFAASSIGVGLAYSLANTYFIYFVTDVALIDSAIMGTVFLLTRIFDLIWTPITAGLIQNTKSKRGKYRSWMIYLVPITCIFVILCFTKITGNQIWVALYYGVMYLLSYGLLDKPAGAQKALMTRMSSNDKERMMLTSRTAQFENIGNIIFAAIALPLVTFFGGGSEAKGFFWVAVLFAIVLLVGYYISAHAAKPYDIYEDIKKKSKTSVPVKELVKVLIKNPPLILSILIEASRYLGYMIFVSTMAYYFKYVIGDMTVITRVTTIATIVCLIGTIVAPAISGKLGKKNTQILSMALYAVGLLAPRFIGVGNLIFFTVCICLIYFAVALQTCVGIVMFSKAADYYENKTGIAAHGFVMSVYVWPVEIGIALSVPIVGWILNAIGYDANATMTAAQITGLENLVLLIPGLICLAGLILAVCHPLSEKKLKEIDASLEEKHKEMERTGQERIVIEGDDM